jgi:AcrR family transcriptional regulator
MTSDVARRESRNQEIPRNAIDAFASRGVRGASLRDIARRSGVSLTLINHHFGSKPNRVWATTNSLHKAAAEPLKRLRVELMEPQLAPHHLISAWVRYLSAAFGGQSKVAHLRLMHRLRSDPDVEKSTRQSLDAAEPLIREAHCALYPEASRTDVNRVLQYCHAALMAGFLGDGSLSFDWSPFEVEDRDRELLVTFVVAAVVGTLGAPDRCSRRRVCLGRPRQAPLHVPQLRGEAVRRPRDPARAGVDAHRVRPADRRALPVQAAHQRDVLAATQRRESARAQVTRDETPRLAPWMWRCCSASTYPASYKARASAL